MADVTIEQAVLTSQEFDDNADEMPARGQVIHLEDSPLYKRGDGVTTLENLPWYGAATEPETSLISGGTITIGSFGGSGSNNDIRVSASSFFIAGQGNFSASQTDFLDITLSSAGTQRYIGLYGRRQAGTILGEIIKVEGTEAALATFPTQPANTCLIGYVLVTDGSVGTTPDLSGYLLKSEKATRNEFLLGSNDEKYLTSFSAKSASKLVTRDYTNSSSITGTTSLTKIGSGILIPAGVVGEGKIVSIRAAVGQVGASGNSTISLYTNTTDTLSGATLLGSVTGAVFYAFIERHLVVRGATTYLIWPPVNAGTDLASNGSNANVAADNVLSLDWTVDRYIIPAFTPSTSVAVSTRRWSDVIIQ